MRFSRAATVHRRAPGLPDEYRNEVLTTKAEGTWPAELQQTGTTEHDTDRNTTVTDWLLMLDPAGSLTRLDVVTVAGEVDPTSDEPLVFEVIGAPELVHHPWTGAPDHWEAHLRLVEG